MNQISIISYYYCSCIPNFQIQNIFPKMSTMQCVSSPIALTMSAETLIDSDQRRSANYKPNIWKYDLLMQSLNSKYHEEEYTTRAEKLRQELEFTFTEVTDELSILQLVDSILKLGLSSYFQDEIKHSLNAKTNSSIIHDDLYSAALRFRILRTFGYDASQEMFRGFVEEDEKFQLGSASDMVAMNELFEASNLSDRGENLMDKARLFSMKNMGCFDGKEAMKNVLPLHWTAEWYNIKKHILAFEKEGKTNSNLLELARLNFNIVQAEHQKDLKEISRWWRDLGISEELSFSRDRMVESFLFAGGVAYEPKHGSLRKWLSKVIKLVLIIDDVYDIYGTLEDLQSFTTAVIRWRPEEVKELPKCMQTCFWTLFNTTHEISAEIEEEKGWNAVLPHLQKAWGEFCKSLLLEAKWENEGYTPSLGEYLENATISSSGPLLSLHVIFGVENPTSKTTISQVLQDYGNIIYCTSLIIRLCNDLGTFTAELERGDAPSSILCHMRESNVTEDIAREQIKGIITRAWQKINYNINNSFDQQVGKKYLINEARVAHSIYQNGDGFGVQDKKRVISILIEPLPLS